MTSIEVNLSIPPELLDQFNASLDRVAALVQLQSVPQPAAPPAFDKSIFISYRRADSSYITGRIYDRLVSVFGPTSVFRDVDDILAGRDFTQQLDMELQTADLMLVMIGKDWLDIRNAQTGLRRLDNENDIVRMEIAIGLERDIPMIPVLLRGASMPKAFDLPEPLQALSVKSGLSVDPDPDFHDDLTRLIEKINQTLGA